MTHNSKDELNAELTVKQMILYNRIGVISAHLAQRLQIAPEQAFDLFYESHTCERLHNECTGLYLMSDLYIVDEVILELQNK